MDFLRPTGWEEALAAKAEHPTAVPIAGGTDVMVEINFDHRRPEYLLDLNRVTELQEWHVGEETVQLGASVPYTRIMENLRVELPGLALASHTVATPQIRNRGGVGGNLGTASPAGDAHPALLAAGAEVEVESVRGNRFIPIDEFYTGVKRNALQPDELIKTVHIKKADGPQQYSKVGTRNAMVIAVCAFGLALHPETRTVRTGIGWEGESLLYVLRERMGLPGSKNACEQGECGSCTVRLDGVPVCSCLVAAGQVEGREVVTVEGLADFAEQREEHGGHGACGTSLDAAKKWQARPADSQTGEAGSDALALSPIQQAFIDAGAVQCGFCTPGLLVAADELLERRSDPSDQDIREALSGNLCRCTGYEKILDAVRLAAARQERQKETV